MAMEVLVGTCAGALVGLMIMVGFGVNAELEKQTCLEAGFGTATCGVHEEDYE
jgi:hypothetical protein